MNQSLGKFYLLLTITAVLWGAQPVLVKTVIKELTPVTITSFRYLLISITLFSLMFFTHEKRFFPPKRCILPLILMSLSGIALNNIAQFSGLRYSTVTNATLIAATTPAVTAFLSAVFLKERLLPLQWLGIIISLCGAAFLVSHGSLAVILNISFNYGDILFFTSQIGWAVYALLSIRVMKELSVLATTAWAGLMGAAFTAIYGLASGELFYAPLSLAGGLSLVYIIWGGGVCAMMFWNSSVKVTGPSRAAIFLNIMPIIGILCGVIFLNEALSSLDFFGGIAILAGVYITTHSQQIMQRIYPHPTAPKM